MLSIGSGEVTPQKVYLKIDSDKQGYIEYPDGTYQATVAGLIDTTWNHSAGAIRLIVPKNNSSIRLHDDSFNPAAYFGNFKTNTSGEFLQVLSSINSFVLPFKTSIVIQGSMNATLLSCVNAISIDALNCPNLPTSNLYKIIDDMYQLYLDGRNLTGGILNLGGTTQAIDTTTSSVIHSMAYDDILNKLDLAGVTITIVINLGGVATTINFR